MPTPNPNPTPHPHPHQYDDPSNAYSPLGTDADTDFGDTDTEDSNDDATTVLPHLLPPPSYHDPSPCAPR